MSEQSKEEAERIRKQWDEEIARIKAAREAQGIVDCPVCEGDGITDDDDFRECPACGGEGRASIRTERWLARHAH